MQQNRHRGGTPGRPWWRVSRPLLPIVVITLLLGAIVGVAAARVTNRRPVAAAPSTSPTSLPAPTASIVPPTTTVDPSTSTDTTVSSSSSRSTTTTRQPPARPDTPILQQRRPVPDGVLEQMTSSIGGAGGEFFCDPEFGIGVRGGTPREPTIAIGTVQRPNFAELEVAEPIQLCLWRFEKDHPIQVEVRYPNGRVVQLTGYAPESPCPSGVCYSHVNWAAVSGDPPGDYAVTAVQGQLRALGTIRVLPATGRHILVVGNGSDEGQYQRFKRGQTVRVAAAGYQPRAGVQLLIYHTPARELQRSGELQFRTWVQLRTDARGGAVSNLRTAADDPPGCYALDTRPAPQTDGRTEEHVQGDDWVNLKDTAPLFCLT